MRDGGQADLSIATSNLDDDLSSLHTTCLGYSSPSLLWSFLETHKNRELISVVIHPKSFFSFVLHVAYPLTSIAYVSPPACTFPFFQLRCTNDAHREAKPKLKSRRR